MLKYSDGWFPLLITHRRIPRLYQKQIYLRQTRYQRKSINNVYVSLQACSRPTCRSEWHHGMPMPRLRSTMSASLKTSQKQASFLLSLSLFSILEIKAHTHTQKKNHESSKSKSLFASFICKVLSGRGGKLLCQAEQTGLL